MNELNKLVLIGNGFDLAHGLKTSYKDFLDWYMCDAFNIFLRTKYYNDALIEFTERLPNQIFSSAFDVKTLEDVMQLIGQGQGFLLKYNSHLFQRLISAYKEQTWVNVEHFYFQLLKAFFGSNNLQEKDAVIAKLNADFNYLIIKLSEHIDNINKSLLKTSALPADVSRSDLDKLFQTDVNDEKTFYVNFNYTETLAQLEYAQEDEVLHIHGRYKNRKDNPIMFGYGDETDPTYQAMEDTGNNLYLEHMKFFRYFETGNYHKLLSFIDLKSFDVFIVGHSCGLSDRVLLSSIFEHKNCQKIFIYYHVKQDGSDNFKELTQEISRHFKSNNKSLMRARIINKNPRNIIPQSDGDTED